MQSTHSLFFKSLTDRGYDLTFHKASDSSIPFQDHGDFLFDALIVFAPKSDNWNEMDISVNTVLEFIDSGAGNVLVAGDADLNYFASAMADECGAEFGSSGNFVIDHLSFDQSDFGGYHTLIVADSFVDSAVLSGNASPILYQGNGLSLRADNKLVFPILSGSSTSFCQNPEELSDSSLHATGSNLVLVAGLQARNNARVVVSGSIDMFSDKYFTSEIQSKDGSMQKSGNAEFATDLAQWVFGERGLIRVKSVSHHLVGETESKDAYTVKENIVYTIEIEEFDGKKWVAYSASNVQLELQMLDPYIRKTLTDQGNGVFSATFQLPDVYGVFTFKVDYHRVGYTSISERALVTILPLRHTDYERFIPSAFPYYASAFSMMAGVALFSLIFLFSNTLKTVNMLSSDVAKSTYHADGAPERGNFQPMGLNGEEPNPHWVYAPNSDYSEEAPQQNFSRAPLTPKDNVLVHIQMNCDRLLGVTNDPSAVLEYNYDYYARFMIATNSLVHTIEALQDPSILNPPQMMPPRGPPPGPQMGQGPHGQMQHERTYQPPPGFSPAPTNIPGLGRNENFDFSDRGTPQQQNNDRNSFHRSNEDVKASASNMMSSFNSNKGYSLVWDGKNGNSDEKPQRRTRKRKIPSDISE